VKITSIADEACKVLKVGLGFLLIPLIRQFKSPRLLKLEEFYAKYCDHGICSRIPV
jgi:hypothetical protein